MSLSKHRCEVCDLSFTSYQHFSIHLGGRLHNEKQRKEFEAQGDSVQRPSRITDNTEYSLSGSHQSTGTNVSILTALHSQLKMQRSTIMSLPSGSVLTSLSQSYHPSVTVASTPTDSLHSSHSYSEFADPRDSLYKDNRQLDKQDSSGWENYRSHDVPWRKEQSATEALAQTRSSVKCSSKGKSSILALLSAQRLLQETPLEETFQKKPVKAEVKSRDSVRSLLSAQFDLLKSYMTEPQRPASMPEPEKVRASRTQPLSTQKAAEWSDASQSEAVGSAVMRNVQSRHSLEAADQYSKDWYTGERSQALVKTPSDFWSRQATNSNEVQSDLGSGIPFLGEGYLRDDGRVEEQQASFTTRSHDHVEAGSWDRDDDGFRASQWDRSVDHASRTTHASDVSMGSGPNRSDVWQSHGHDNIESDVPNRGDVPGSSRTWHSHRDDNVKPVVPSNMSMGSGPYKSDVSGSGRTWQSHRDDNVTSGVPSDVSMGSGPYRSDVPGSDRTWQSHRHDDVKSDIPPDAWEPRVDRNSERTAERADIDERRFEPNEDYHTSQPLFSSDNRMIRPVASAAYQQSLPSFRDDFRRPLPPPPAIETNRSQSSMEEFMTRVKMNLQRDLKYGTSFPEETSRLEERPAFGRSLPAAVPLLETPLTVRKVLLQTPSTAKPSGTSFNVPTKSPVNNRKILLPTPEPTTEQSPPTSLPSSSSGTSWSQPDGRGGMPPSQQHRQSSTHGGGQLPDSSVAVWPPKRTTLLRAPPASGLQPGSYGNSSSTGAVSSTRAPPLRAALPAQSAPVKRNFGADTNLVKAETSKTLLTSQPLPLKSSLKSNVAATKQPQTSSGKLQTVATCGPDKSEMGEVDPQLKLQKEIEVVMGERVEDLMKAIPESMMRSIMDGKVPLEFLDKISDLIPNEVIEDAVKQKEQSAADKCTLAGSNLLRKGTSQLMVAKPEIRQASKDGVERKMEEHHLEGTAVTEVAVGVNVDVKVELVKKMIDEILGDLANETCTPSNTDILDKLSPDDRSMVLEMQDVVGIRDVSVMIEILEFFKTLDRNILLTLSTIDDKDKDGGESVVKRMTKLMLNNYSKTHPSTSTVAEVVCKNTPTHSNSGPVTPLTNTKQSQMVAGNTAGLRSSVQPLTMTNSSRAVASQHNKVAIQQPQGQWVAFAPKSSSNVTVVQAVKGPQNKAGIKTPLLDLPKTSPNAPCGRTGGMQKPVISVVSVAQTVKGLPCTSQNKAGIKTPLLDLPKTPPNAPCGRTGGLQKPVTSVVSVAQTTKVLPCTSQNKAGIRTPLLDLPKTPPNAPCGRTGGMQKPVTSVVSVAQTTKVLPCMSQNKVEIKTPFLELPDAPPNAPCGRTGGMQKPVIISLSVLPKKELSVSESFGVKTVSNVPPTVTDSACKAGIKAAFGLHPINSTGSEKTPPCVPQTKPVVAELNSVNASRTGVGSEATLVKSQSQGILRNTENKAQISETKAVTSTLENPTKGNVPSTVMGATVLVKKSPSVEVKTESKPLIILPSQKVDVAVAGKTEFKGTSVDSSANSSGILKTPEVVSSSTVNDNNIGSDKLSIRGSSDAALSKTKAAELPVEGPDSNAQINVSNEVSGAATVTVDAQQTKAAVAVTSTSVAVTSTATEAVTLSVTASQSKSSPTDETDNDKQSEMGTKSNEPLPCSSSDVTLSQPSTVDVQPAEQSSNEKAEKRKAAEPLEANKKAKLEANPIVSEKPATTSSTSTVKETRPNTSHVASVSSTTGEHRRCLLTSPTLQSQQSTKQKNILLPTPVRTPPHRRVPLLSTPRDVLNKQPPSRAPFPRQTLLSTPREAWNKQPPSQAHRMARSPPRKLPRPPRPLELHHPADRMRAATLLPLPSPPVRMSFSSEPFRSRNFIPMNSRPCLPEPILNQHPMHAGNNPSFRFPRPNVDNLGPPPFKRWR